MKKSIVMSVAVAVFGVFAAWASDEASVLLFPNGDVEIENVGSASAARRTFVELCTNADCRVVCQVYYRDNSNLLPTEIEVIDETDRTVNLLLATYLCELWELAPDELVDAYRSGVVFEHLSRFPEWVTKATSELGDAEALENLDLTVVAVSMTAVGEFAKRVSE